MQLGVREFGGAGVLLTESACVVHQECDVIAPLLGEGVGGVFAVDALDRGHQIVGVRVERVSGRIEFRPRREAGAHHLDDEEGVLRQDSVESNAQLRCRRLGGGFLGCDRHREARRKEPTQGCRHNGWVASHRSISGSRLRRITVRREDCRAAAGSCRASPKPRRRGREGRRMRCRQQGRGCRRRAFRALAR